MISRTGSSVISGSRSRSSNEEVCSGGRRVEGHVEGPSNLEVCVEQVDEWMDEAQKKMRRDRIRQINRKRRGNR